MKHYKHLTQEQRYQISGLLKTKISQSEVARVIGVSKSTISRELKRNTGKEAIDRNKPIAYPVTGKPITVKPSPPLVGSILRYY